MDQSEIRLSNYNYDANHLIDHVRSLFARDRGFLGPIIQRSAVTRTPSGEIQHCITKIDVLSESNSIEQPEVLDYGRLIFIREIYDEDSLLSRLNGLTNKTFTAGQHILTTTGMGFGDRYEASNNSYSTWPCTVFDISFGNTQLSTEPLLHPTLRSFSSWFEAIKEVLKFRQFHDSSDARLGHILICIPNLNGRLEKLVLNNHHLQVTISGRKAPAAFKLDIHYKTSRESQSIEKPLDDYRTQFDLAFIPTELRLWLIAKEGFVADFHGENEYYSTGGNSVLTKRTPVTSAFEIEAEPDTFDPTPLEPAPDSRVFVIHGHDSSAKESLARFLEKLGLEAIILHEQANKGATIIEKFQLHSEVSFAVALLTGDDEAREAGTSNQLKRRARQNVLFEFGFFIGKLGRTRVCALVEEGIEIPSDYQGVVFIPLDSSGHWRFDLIRELKAAGLNVNANRAF